MADLGRVGHEKNPQYTKFVCFIVEKLRITNRFNWKNTFTALTENTTYDINDIRKDVWERLNGTQHN